MKKIFFLAAACAMSLAANAQTMNVHLKDGSVKQYTSAEVEYVDFTAAEAETPETPADDAWSLVASGVSFVEYYESAPSFTSDLYKSADGTKYKFADFTTGYDFVFTLGDAVTGDFSYLGNYIIPEGGSWYGSSYWYFGEDLWNTSFPLTWKNWPGHYMDYAAVYTGTTYTTISLEEGTGWMCLYGYPYLTASPNDTTVQGNWYYLYFSWEKPAALTLADLEGTYLEHTTGYWNADCDYSDTVTVVIDDAEANTIRVKGFSTSAEDLIGTVDLDAKTITFTANQPFYTWYTFSAESDINTPVVGTIADDGTITISSWAPWYNWGGTDYAYASGMVSTLTKQ